MEIASPLFAIADLDTMWVNLNVYESHLPYIRLGQSVKFFPDGLPGVRLRRPRHLDQPAGRSLDPHHSGSRRGGQSRRRPAGQHVRQGPIAGRRQPHDRLVVSQAAVQSHDGDHVVFVEKPNNVFEVRAHHRRAQGRRAIGRSPRDCAGRARGHDRQLPAQVEPRKPRIRQGSSSKRALSACRHVEQHHSIQHRTAAADAACWPACWW